MFCLKAFVSVLNLLLLQFGRLLLLFLFFPINFDFKILNIEVEYFMQFHDFIIVIATLAPSSGNYYVNFYQLKGSYYALCTES